MLDGEVTIHVGDLMLSGWQRIRIRRSCEQVPNSFEVGYVSEETGGIDTLVNEGDACTVTVGSDLVLTGHVDLVHNDGDGNGHDLTLAGRGKCADLVDCTSEWPTSTILNDTVGGVAAKLARPYGISVPPPPTDVSLPAFSVTLIESPFTLIEEMTRYAQLLVYEDEAGNLILADVGETTAGGGLVWGQNVLRAKLTRSMADRYSEYVCYINATTNALGDIHTDINVRAFTEDSGVQRHRRLAFTLDAPVGVGEQDFATRVVQWERSRRAGRSRKVTLEVLGWRDAGGALWAPNTRVPLDLPKHGITGETWVIGDVTYLRDEGGTRTELMLMPPAAFQPQPDLLVDPLADVVSAVPPGGSSSVSGAGQG